MPSPAPLGAWVIDEVPQSEKKILIDNLPFNHQNSKIKLQAMGGGMYLKVPDWEGENPKDNALKRALSTIKKTFNFYDF